MQIIWKWFFIVLISLSIGKAESTIYSWQSCIELTQQNNLELKAAYADIESANLSVNVSFADFLPKLSASVSRTDQKTERRSTGLVGINNSNTGHNYSAGLSASLNLFSGMKDFYELRQAQTQILLSQAKFNEINAKISYELKRAFEQFLYAKNYVNLSQIIFKRREENYHIVKMRFQNGLENKGSLLLSQAYLEQARYDQLQASNAILNARADLARNIGLENWDEFDIQGEIPFQPPQKTAPDLDELSQKTPEYLKNQAQEQSADFGVSLAYSNFYPGLDITGSVRHIGEDFLDKQTTQKTVLLSLSIPLWDGGRDFFGVKKAKWDYLRLSNTRQQSKRLIVSTLRESYSSWVESNAKLAADTLFQSAALTRAQIARSKYNNGLLTFENWDIIENDLINRQKNYLVSKRDRVLTEAKWHQIIGAGVL